MREANIYALLYDTCTAGELLYNTNIVAFARPLWSLVNIALGGNTIVCSANVSSKRVHVYSISIFGRYIYLLIMIVRRLSTRF